MRAASIARAHAADRAGTARVASSASVSAFKGAITSLAFDRSMSAYGTSANGWRFFSSSRKCASCVTSDSATAAEDAPRHQRAHEVHPRPHAGDWCDGLRGNHVVGLAVQLARGFERAHEAVAEHDDVGAVGDVGDRLREVVQPERVGVAFRRRAVVEEAPSVRTRGRRRTPRSAPPGTRRTRTSGTRTARRRRRRSGRSARAGRAAPTCSSVAWICRQSGFSSSGCP